MREKRVRLSEEEHDILTDLRDEKYPGVPLGYVIRELAESTLEE